MRRTLIGLAVVIGLSATAKSSRAQDGGFSDPFFLYYGFYLPRQAALAAQPQPDDQIRAQSAQRQYEVRSERQGLYDPGGGLGLDDLDPLRPFGQRSGSSRLARTTPTGIVSQNLTGRGPAGYYMRHNSYYPTMRVGRGRNAGTSGVALGGGMSAPRGMGGMGGMSMPPTTSIRPTGR